jgi:hypothetical protein
MGSFKMLKGMKFLYGFVTCVFFFIFIFRSTCLSQPPSFSWAKTLGNAQRSASVVGIEPDSNNAIIVTGYYSGTIDFDAGSNTFNLGSTQNSVDVFITKYTVNGNFVWAKSFGSSAFDFVEMLKRDRAGNLYLTGIFQGTTDFDPGLGVFEVTNVGGRNTFVLKLDKDGNFLWVKTFTGYGNTLDIDDNGNVLVGGFFGGTVDFDPGPTFFNLTTQANQQDMFIMKLNNQGLFAWAKQLRNLGASQHQQYGLETDPSGNVYFAGNFTNSIDFDPSSTTVSLTSNGIDDAFILKLNAQGDYQWAKQFGSSDSDKAFALEVDHQGNVFTTGQFSGTVDFDPNVGVFNLTSPSLARCAFISKLNTNGNLLYAKNFQTGSSFGLSITIDSSNNLYIAGGFSGTVDFDPGPGIFNLQPNVLFNVKLNPVGDFIWAAGYIAVPPSYFESSFSALKVDPFNNVYYAGNFANSIDFDPGSSSAIFTSANSFDGFFLKLGNGSCNNPTSNTINVQGCQTYVLNGVTYSQSGEYYQILTNSVGCDSIIRINLTIANRLTNVTQISCGPYIWNGKIYNTTGIYRDTIRLSSGCDSIITLDLTVNAKPIVNLGRDTVLCIGDTIKLTTSTSGTYLWNNGNIGSTITVTQPGLYWLNVSLSNGCSNRDSININTSSSCYACGDLKLVERIYPIPFGNNLNIKIKNSTCQLKVDFYNTLGQLVLKGINLQSGINNIKLQALPAAAYFYRIYSEGAILAEGKVMKQ